MPNPIVVMCRVSVGEGGKNNVESSFMFVSDKLTNMDGVSAVVPGQVTDCATAQAKFRVCRGYSGSRAVDCMATINAPPSCMSN